MMSCYLRSSLIVDDVVGRSRETCTFLTFGKSPTTPHPAVVPPSTTRNSCVSPPSSVPAATKVGVCGTGCSRERKSSTETGPPDPSALRPGSESTTRAQCSSPEDDDDVFPVVDVGCSSIASSRSNSIPPRRSLSCAQSLSTSEVSTSNAATAIKISPPRMKRRKKKNANTESSDSQSLKVGSSMSSGSSNSVLPVASRHSYKAAEVTNHHEKNNSRNSDSSNKDDNCLWTEQPASELNASQAPKETEKKRKKNIRWKTDLAQSSPDVASDDADSKESGYITLEDLQAQLGLSSWSSDERQTDQDVLSSSGDELRAPEGLGGVQSASLTSSEFEAPSAALLLPLPASSSFLTPLIPPDQSDVFGGAIECCRSAPPTCDASLLKFTFTVRLDSKMFHRRAANRSGRRDPPLIMVTDGKERGQCRKATDGDEERCELTGNQRETDEEATASVVDNACSQTAKNQSLPSSSRPSADKQNTYDITQPVFTTTATSPPDCGAVSSSNSVQQFVGEKVVVTAEVHRSADQLDTDRPKTPKTLNAASNGLRLKKKSFATKIETSSQQGRASDRDRALSTSCQPDDIIVSCSPEAEFVHRQCSMTSSIHRDQSDRVVDGGFTGRLNYVDVDKVVSQTKRQTFDRQQKSTSVVSQRSTKKISDGLTLTLRRPLKLHQSDRPSMTDVKTLPRKKSSDTSARQNERKTDDGIFYKVQSTTDAGRRTTYRHLSCERTVGRMFSESSSISSDSEPDICGPCLSRESTTTSTVACSRGCTANCSRRGGKAGILKTADGPSKASTVASSVTRSKSTRRALRQFFRVENLFACRHGRPSSEKYPSIENNEHQDIGCVEETSRMETLEDASCRRTLANRSESMMCRGRCGKSTLQSESSATRTCRRRQSKSSRRTDAGRGGGATSTTSRSVSPHARSRAADERRTDAAGTCCRAAGRHRSRDRSSTVGRCRPSREDCSVLPAANGHGGRQWNTLCVSPSDNCFLTAESGCGFSSRRRVLATTPISPSTPAPDSLHAVTLGKMLCCRIAPFIVLCSCRFVQFLFLFFSVIFCFYLLS